MISVKLVTKCFGDMKAVDSVTFEVPSCGSVAILGPSGCGKTTLLRLIAGLEVLDEGEIFINEMLASKKGYVLAPCHRDIGFVFQRPSLWPHMTVAQNILFGLNGVPIQEARERLHKMMDCMSLNDVRDRYPGQISGGEAKRVAIARSLAPQPRYLLMDEPLTNLDFSLKEKMLDVIKKTIYKTQAVLIYVTHSHEEAEQLSGPVLTMEMGRIINSGGGKFLSVKSLHE